MDLVTDFANYAAGRARKRFKRSEIEPDLVADILHDCPETDCLTQSELDRAWEMACRKLGIGIDV